MQKNDVSKTENADEPADDFTKVGDLVGWVLDELLELNQAADEIKQLEGRGDSLSPEDEAELGALRTRRDELISDFGWSE